MRADRIVCDTVSYNALLSALVNGGQADMVSDLFDFKFSYCTIELSRKFINTILPLLLFCRHMIPGMRCVVKKAA